MSDTSASINRMTGGDFRIGRVFDRTISLYTRNFLLFSLVTLVAFTPSLLLNYGEGNYLYSPGAAKGAAVNFLTALLSIVLWLLSQAILVHGAFQDMRGRPVNLYESVNVSLARFFPILGLTIFVALAITSIVVGMMLIAMFLIFGLRYSPNAGYSILPVIGVIIGFIVLAVAALMLITRWFVVIPICMVERLGPWRSLIRSSQLTKGHRWKVFGIILLLYIGASIIGAVIGITITAVGGRIAGLVASLILNTILGAFFAIYVVVTYYELRSAKDGVDVEQIASVFD